MAISIVSFSRRGAAVGDALRCRFADAGRPATHTRCGGGGPSVREWVGDHFSGSDGLVFIGAVGIAVRALAPHLSSKTGDPPVVVVDDQARHAVSLLSGHIGGANALARTVADFTGATPVITTATDGAGLFALDTWAAENGLAVMNPSRIAPTAQTALAGETVAVYSAFPVAGLPPGYALATSAGEADVIIDVRAPAPADADAEPLWLTPRLAVLGVGCRRGVSKEALAAAVGAFFTRNGCAEASLCQVSSIDIKRDEPGLIEFCRERGVEFVVHDAERLAGVAGDFADSDTVFSVAGVGSVCDRAVAASGATLVVGKTIVDGVALAVGTLPYTVPFPAAPDGPPGPGKVYAVGIGPGGEAGLTAAARAALTGADMLCGYAAYIDLIAGAFPGKEVVSTGMTGEVERCRLALDAAAGGKTVAVVSSGDAGVYGMAGLLLELAGDHPPVDIEVVPGVSAAMSAAAVLGAPLMHDFAVISLSDLLTPWATIAARLRAAAAADFVICLYNPVSRTRPDTLKRACDIVLAERPADTVCGWVRNAGRAGQDHGLLRLGELRDHRADMLTTVFIGASTTRVINGRMVTPRGYRRERP